MSETIIPAFKEIGENAYRVIINEQLKTPIIEVLTQRGPLACEAIQYFLKRNHGITIGLASLITTLTWLSRGPSPTHEQYIRGQNNEPGKQLYAVGNIRNSPTPPIIPAPTDYTAAYLELYLRYQAIRNNPELATMPESLIDDLYNPVGHPSADVVDS